MKVSNQRKAITAAFSVNAATLAAFRYSLSRLKIYNARDVHYIDFQYWQHCCRSTVLAVNLLFWLTNLPPTVLTGLSTVFLIYMFYQLRLWNI